MGPGVDQLLADEQVTSSTAPGDTLWALNDNLGSVRDVIRMGASSADDVLLHRAYDSYGNVLYETHSPGAEFDILFGYTGRQFDSATGMQNNLHRWYDPRVGRWISEDPIGFAAGDANLYRYVGNSPTNAVDPSGLQGIMNVLFPPGWRDGLIPLQNNLTVQPNLPNRDVERGREWWYQEGVVKRLYNRGFRYGGDFLFHSLQDSPHNLRFDVGSDLSNRIKGNTDFLRTVKEKILDPNPGNVGWGKAGGRFLAGTDRDLFYAIHRYKLDYAFVDRNGKCVLEIGLTDTYDFASRIRDLFKVANWKAFVAAEAQGYGVIQRYETLVKVDFSEAEIAQLRNRNFAATPQVGFYD